MLSGSPMSARDTVGVDGDIPVARQDGHTGVPAINPRTGREITIEEQYLEQSLYPAGTVREIMQRAVLARKRQQEATNAIEEMLTRDQVIITRSIREEQNRRWRVEEQDMIFRLAGPPSHRNSWTSIMLSMVLPEDRKEFVAAMAAMRASEVRALQRAQRGHLSIFRDGAACDYCGLRGAPSKCSGCHPERRARYCDRDCQRSAWKEGHKTACLRRKLQATSMESPSSGGFSPQ
jgi:hypothetical protein